MLSNWQQSKLPVLNVIEKLKSTVSKHPISLLNAPPGAGKSTIVPIALLDEPWLNDKKIIVLEPRRLATKTIACRLAENIGEEVGNTIGYRIRFEVKISKKTKIEVVTEGILTRILQADSALQEVGLVIFDEFHERNIHSDLALALCQDSQSILRSDLKILIMSATLNLEELNQTLKAPLIQSEGRQHPVEIIYEGEADERMLPELVAELLKKVTRRHEGDTLVFLPGKGEILKCQEILRKTHSKFHIHPLYSQLPFNKQKAAIFPHREGIRKIILATSIAETSLTIEGVKVVVDTGFGRVQKWDSKSGLSRLETVRISRDAADQRAGRSGRLGPGVCYRMWTKKTENHMSSHRTPEIMETDLGPLTLDLANWGVLNPNQLNWVNKPPKKAIYASREMLEELGATENERITEHGKRMHKLPCHPRIAHMLLMAQQDGLTNLATDIASLIEEKDPMSPNTGVDINIRIDLLRKFRSENRLGKKWKRIEKVSENYRNLFNIAVEDKPVDAFETGLLLTYAYPERIACARLGNNAQFQLANGEIATIGHTDDLAYESWLAVAHVDARQGIGKIFLASPLNPRDLQKNIKERKVVDWDSDEGGLTAKLQMRIGSIVLKSSSLPNPDPEEKTTAICKAIKKSNGAILNWTEKVEQWQNRILSLKKWRQDEKWPDVSRETLVLTCEEWLTPFLKDIKTSKDLKKIDIKEVLKYSLPQSLQTQLESLAPEKLTVPSGSKIPVLYRPKGEPPVISVRIQELFGLKKTPTLCEETIEVLIHLLSPSFKPIQITTDLKNFWSDTYFTVRKDLKRRYPKHYWPEDPTSAEAMKGIKRK